MTVGCRSCLPPPVPAWRNLAPGPVPRWRNLALGAVSWGRNLAPGAASPSMHMVRSPEMDPVAEPSLRALGGLVAGAGPGGLERRCWFDGVVVDDAWVAGIVLAEGEDLLGWECHRIRGLGNVLITISAEPGYAAGQVGALARLRVLLPSNVVAAPGWGRVGTFAGYLLDGELIVRRTIVGYWDPLAPDGVTALFEVEAWRFTSTGAGGTIVDAELRGTIIGGVGIQAMVGDPCATAGEVLASYLWLAETSAGAVVAEQDYYLDDAGGVIYSVPVGDTGCDTLGGIFGNAVDLLFYRLGIVISLSGMGNVLAVSQVPTAYLVTLLGRALDAPLASWFRSVCTCDGVGAVPPPGNLADQAADAGLHG